MMFFSFLPGKEKKDLLETSLPLPAAIEEYQKIRVLVSNVSGPAEILGLGESMMFDASGEVLERASNLQLKFYSHAEGIQVGTKIFRGNSLYVKSRREGVKFEKRTYQHVLEVMKKKSGELAIINHIDFEEYLKGVIPYEANPKWTDETLKAQTIAARTYAFFKMIEKRGQDKDYDVGSSVLSQVYAGKTVQHEVTDRIVDETRGMILMHDKEVFPAYYHSTSGGATTRADKVWDVKYHPSLKGIECEFCHESKHYNWSVTLPFADIEKAIREEGGIPARGVNGIEPKDFDASGRAHEIVIFADNGTYKADANEFRMWLGPSTLKSTLITRFLNKPNEKSVLLFGRGWGHGIGLDQFGAKYMGELGYTHPVILEYFYPGSYIRKIYE